MAGTKSRGSASDLGGDRNDDDRDLGQISFHLSHPLRCHSVWTNEHLRERARREQLVIGSTRLQRGDRGGMVRVARIEERDDDAGVEDYAGHSRRSFFRYPFGYIPVNAPA